MKIILNKNKLIKIVHKQKNLGFVPTMGAIHLGHISLIKKCMSQCDKTVVSIFVNRPQFNKREDFKKYPRTIKNDISILKKLKINYLYLPSHNQIYPNDSSNNIKIGFFGKRLCGKSRPGHFEAVVDVIDRFLKTIKPKKIYLGKKDMQQLKIVEQFVKKNHREVKVVGCKTIREKSGLAYSSRNCHLSLSEKKIASRIFKLLLNKKKYLIKNKSNLKLIRKEIHRLGPKNIDYIELININKIFKPYKLNNNFKIFIAYYIGGVRLIDNI